MQTSLDAQQLVEAVAAGDVAAFEQLVLAYQHRLFNFVLRLCGSAPDAEEIVQDVFVKAFRALGGVSAKGRPIELALTPWLYKIALNTARNRRRRRQPALISLDSADGKLHSYPPGLSAADPEQLLLSADQQAIVARELLRLPVSSRAAVLLRFVEGMSYEEIAEALQQPLGTVKSHIFRGSRRLRVGISQSLAEAR